MDRGPRILVNVNPGFPQNRFDALVSAYPQATFIACSDGTILDHVADVDALIGCTRQAIDDGLMRRAGSRLRWIHANGAGVETFMSPDFVNSDITFTNGKKIQGPEVADHAIALMLAISRNLHLVLRGIDKKDMPRPIEMRGKTVTILGLGGIGTLAAERCHALGMKVLAVDLDQCALHHFVDQYYPLEQIDAALAASDVVMMLAPLTPRSRPLLDKHRFAAMKEGTTVINVSRGGTVDTDALVEALQSGKVKAAGLDVTEPEPLDEDHILRGMTNVIITPHIAGLSDHNRARSFDLIHRNVGRFIVHEPLMNVVNKRLGF